jgi:hypothetical protein
LFRMSAKALENSSDAELEALCAAGADRVTTPAKKKPDVTSSSSSASTRVSNRLTSKGEASAELARSIAVGMGSSKPAEAPKRATAPVAVAAVAKPVSPSLSGSKHKLPAMTVVYPNGIAAAKAEGKIIDMDHDDFDDEQKKKPKVEKTRKSRKPKEKKESKEEKKEEEKKEKPKVVSWRDTLDSAVAEKAMTPREIADQKKKGVLKKPDTTPSAPAKATSQFPAEAGFLAAMKGKAKHVKHLQTYEYEENGWPFYQTVHAPQPLSSPKEYKVSLDHQPPLNLDEKSVLHQHLAEIVAINKACKADIQATFMDMQSQILGQALAECREKLNEEHKKNGTHGVIEAMTNDPKIVAIMLLVNNDALVDKLYKRLDDIENETTTPTADELAAE